MTKKYILTHFVKNKNCFNQLLNEWKHNNIYYCCFDDKNIVECYKKTGALHQLKKVGELRNEKWVWLIK